MEKSKYKDKAADGAAKPYLDDKFRRCTKCFVGGLNYGEQKIGTMLITEIVRMEVPNAPSVDIARIVRCGNVKCDNVADVILFREAIANGIDKAQIFSLLRSTHATPTFKKRELLSGRLDPVVLSPAILEAISKRTERPAFGRDYNPDERIEGSARYQNDFPPSEEEMPL